MKVKLKMITDGMEDNNNETRVYYSIRDNGLKYYGDYFETDEEEDDFDDDDLILLPDQYEINEYRLMEDFIKSIDDVKTYNCMAISIRGSGAFRRFKDMAINLGIIDKWYRYRDDAYKKIAVEWCERNKLEYEE